MVTGEWVANLKIENDKIKRNVLLEQDVPFLNHSIVEDIKQEERKL